MPLCDDIKNIALFATLTDQQCKSLAASCHASSCPKGTLLFSEGSEAAGIYIMLSGRVKIFRAAPDGREAVLHVFGPGEPLGEVAVFQGGKYPASAECVETGKALFLPRKALREAISKDPGLAFNMLAALSSRLRAFVAKVETLTLMETPQRLAAYLLLASEEQKNENTDVVHLDVSKSLLAGILGTARETLSRCLGRMVEQGSIRLEGRKVFILDRAFLEELAKGTENL